MVLEVEYNKINLYIQHHMDAEYERECQKKKSAWGESNGLISLKNLSFQGTYKTACHHNQKIALLSSRAFKYSSFIGFLWGEYPSYGVIILPFKEEKSCVFYFFHFEERSDGSVLKATSTRNTSNITSRIHDLSSIIKSTNHMREYHPPKWWENTQLVWCKIRPEGIP